MPILKRLLILFALLTSLASPLVGKTLEVYWRIGYKIVVVGKGTPDEKSHRLDAAPQIINGVYFFPVRFLSEFTGHNVVWLITEKSAIIRGGGKTLKLFLGKTAYESNGAKKRLDAEPFLVSNRLMVPGKFFSDELSLQMVSMDEKSATMTIDSEAIKPKAVDFTLMTHQGGTVNFDTELNSAGTKLVLVNFWSTRCYPCRLEIPHLIKLYNKYKDTGFKIIGVSTDSDAGDTMDIERAEYIDELGMNYIVALDPLAEVYYQWGGLGVPNVSLVDRTGFIIYQHEGLDLTDRLENFIKKQLGL
jgi:peroxiredoxin